MMVRYTYLLPIEVAHVGRILTKQLRVLRCHIVPISPNLMAAAIGCIFVFSILVPSCPWLIVIRVRVLLSPGFAFCSVWMLLNFLVVIASITFYLMLILLM